MTNSKHGNTVKTRRHRTAERRGSLELHNGKWRIVALVNGEKIRKSTGTANREEAERIRREWMSVFTARDKVAQAERLADAVKTAQVKAEEAARRAADALPALRIDEAFDKYLNDFARKMERPTTESTNRSRMFIHQRFNRWIIAHHPDCVEMRQLDEAIAREYLETLGNEVSTGSFKLHLTFLKGLWNILGETAKCKVNPWQKFKSKPRHHHRRENFTPEQLDLIFKSIPKGSELYVLCQIGRYTGLRLVDAACLEWASVDFAANLIELVPLKVKRFGKAVRIPIHDDLRRTLEAMPHRGKYVLPDMAAKCKVATPLVSSEVISKDFVRFLRSIGIETSERVEGYNNRVCRYGFHSFRHTFITQAAENGVPLSVVQELVGHLSDSQTQAYFHLNDEAARRAIAVLPGTGAKVKAKSKVEAAVATLAGLNKRELKAVRAKLDALLK